MARRSKKNLTIEEELAGLKEEITKCEDEIKRLTDRKKVKADYRTKTDGSLIPGRTSIRKKY